MKKKLLALLLCVVMTVSLAAPAVYADEAQPAEEPVTEAQAEEAAPEEPAEEVPSQEPAEEPAPEVPSEEPAAESSEAQTEVTEEPISSDPSAEIEEESLGYNANTVAVIGTEEYSSLADAITAANGSSGSAVTIRLVADVTLSTGLEVAAGEKEITITDDGSVKTIYLRFTGNASTGAIDVISGTLKIQGTNSSSETNKLIINATQETVGETLYANSRPVLSVNGGALYTANLTIVGAANESMASYGAGVRINTGSYTMGSGTSLTKCKTSGNGGGVYNAGIFNMFGGSISGCSAKNGGGIYTVTGSTSNISGGSCANSIVIYKGTANISGGTFTGSFSNGSSCLGIVNVSGGWFKSQLTTVKADDTTSNNWFLKDASGNTLYATGECADAPNANAKYTVSDGYTITYKDYDAENESEADISGISSSSIGVNDTTKTTTLPAANKENYRFDGWYIKGSDGTSLLSSPVEFSDDVTLYAKWTEYVAKVSTDGGTETPYCSLAEAFAAAVKNNSTPTTVTLLANCGVSSRIEIREQKGEVLAKDDATEYDITLNLNEKNITFNGSNNLFLLNENGCLTITGSGSVDCNTKTVFYLNDGAGSVTIAGGTYAKINKIVTGNGSSSLSVTGGTFSIDPSEYTAQGYGAIKSTTNNVDSWNVTDKVLEINDTNHSKCTLAELASKAGDDVEFKLLCDVSLPSRIEIVKIEEASSAIEFSLNLNGHKMTYIGSGTGAIIVRENNTLIITGNGEIDVGAKDCLFYVNATGTITIENGTFTTTNANLNIKKGKGTVSIKGGVFSIDPSTYIAEGYYAFSDAETGPWEVQLIAATIGDVKYKTLEDAITAAGTEAETTIKLPISYTVEDGQTINLNIPYNVTIEGPSGETEKKCNSAITNKGTLILCGAGTISGVAQSKGGGIDNYGTLTINGATITGTTFGGTGSGGAIYNRSSGIIVIESGTVSGSNNEGDALYGGGIYNAEGGNVTINGGSINGTTKAVSEVKDEETTISGGLGGGVYNKGTLVVNGGEITGTAKPFSSKGGQGGGINNTGTLVINDKAKINGSARQGGGIYNKNTVIINGGSVNGEITGDYGGGIYNSAEGSVDVKLIINGGSVTGKASKNGYAIYSNEDLEIGGTAEINQTVYLAKAETTNAVIYGGTIKAEVTDNKTGGSLKVTGGTFSFDPSNYVENSYCSVSENSENNTWTVTSTVGFPKENQNRLTLSDDLKFAFRIVNTSSAENVTVTFSMAGSTTEEIIANNDSVVFDGISPQYIGTDVKAELFVNGVKVDEFTRNIMDYLEGQYTKTGTSNEIKAVIRDLVDYGIAANEYAKIKWTDAIGTEIVRPTWLEGDPASTVAPDSQYKHSQSDVPATYKDTASSYRFTAANVVFDVTNTLYVKYTMPSEGCTMTVGLVNGDTVIGEKDAGWPSNIVVQNVNGICYLRGITAKQYLNTFKFTIMDGATVVRELTYGIGSYTYAMSSSGTTAQMRSLAAATYRYGLSAKAA